MPIKPPTYLFRRWFFRVAGGLVVEATLKYINTQGGKTLNCKTDGKKFSFCFIFLLFIEYNGGGGVQQKPQRKK